MDPTTAAPQLPKPRQGEIWFVELPTDPARKSPRPIVIVSLDARNQNDRALTVRGITTIDKKLLRPAREKLRQLSRARVCDIATCVVLATGILASEIAND
jgi:mRNA-degrading endonuclease toxin of MazEF toxin-antitoxin module